MKTQEWWRKDFIDHSQECRERVDIDGSHVERNLLCEIHVKETNLPFYALLLFSFILLLAPQQIFPVLAPLRIAMMSILLATVVHAVSRISRDMPVIYLPRGVVLALALMVWAILSIPFSLWPSGSLAFLGEQYVKTVIVFLLISSVINTRERLTGITWALVVMAIPLSLTAINNLLSGVTMS